MAANPKERVREILGIAAGRASKDWKPRLGFDSTEAGIAVEEATRDIMALFLQIVGEVKPKKIDCEHEPVAFCCCHRWNAAIYQLETNVKRVMGDGA